jgi:H+/Cl- antiporter ClcA
MSISIPSTLFLLADDALQNFVDLAGSERIAMMSQAQAKVIWLVLCVLVLLGFLVGLCVCVLNVLRTRRAAISICISHQTHR